MRRVDRNLVPGVSIVKRAVRAIPAILLLVALLGSARAAGSSPYALGWTSFPIATGNTPIGVLTVGSELFGLGSTPAQASARTSRMAIWRSRDGRSWTPVPLDPAVFPPGVFISAIVRGGPGYVAVGGKTALQGSEKPEAFVWLSRDGQRWQRVPHQAAFDGAGMGAITAGGPGLVAVGSIPTNGRVPISQERGVVWTSPDGRTWKKLENKVFAGANIYQVIRAGPGLLAVGDSYPAPPPYGSHAVVWTSRNGSDWRRVPRDPKVFVDGSGMFAVVAGAHGLLATGITEPPNLDYRSLLWTSRDGITWRLAPGDPLLHGLVHRVIAVGPGYLAIGEQDGNPVLWSSLDGAHWRRAVGSEVFSGYGTQLNSIVTVGGHIVVVGSRSQHGPGPGGTPTVWIWTPGSTVRPAPVVRNPLDARAFRLRFTDLPRGYTSPMEAGLLICDLEDRPDPGGVCHRMLQILGNYTACTSTFNRTNGAGQIVGNSIIVPSSARAQQALRKPDVLMQPLNAPPPQRMSTPIRIGQEFRLYRVQLLRGTVFQGESPYQSGVAGIWRDGRAIGMVELTDTGKTAEATLIHLAQAMHRHFQS